MGGHLLQRTGRTGPGGTGSPAQGVFGVSCQASWGAIFFREPGAPARGGRGVLPRGCSEYPARPVGGPSSSENRAHRPGGDGESCPGGVRSLLPGPMGGHLLQRTGRTGLGGTGSPTQGVFGVSCKASGGPSSSENRAHRPRGDGESCPGGVRSLLPGQWGAIFFREPGAPARGGRGVLPRGCSESPARPMGGHLLQRTGRTGLGGTGSPAQGVFGASCQANGGPSSSENRAHRPGEDGESCPGGVRSLLPGQLGGHLLQRTGRTGPGGTGSPAQGVFGVSCQGQWGAIFFREPGAPARGGRGVLPRGCSESPARPVGGPSSSENRAHRPGEDGESYPGGVRSLLPGQLGGHLLQRTGRTGPGGTGSPAQGVFGVSCQANGGPSSSENRAHRPGEDGESCPGGVRSLLQDPWGATFLQSPPPLVPLRYAARQ